MEQLIGIQFTVIEFKKSKTEMESVIQGAKLIKAYFYSNKIETHQNWAHNPYGILSHNLRNQVLGLNIGTS